ncbi:MAG: COX15/CtaA family protein [Bacteroidota bacterium]|nr:COX15/CtaA family protein [Bacteroidota bacterium]
MNQAPGMEDEIVIYRRLRMNYFCHMRIRKTVSPNRAVAYWVLGGTIMLMIQVMLGGITRLTGSGLSITEWNVITGVVPPLHNQEWMLEFDKYKQTPQYQLLNTGFSLSDFKFIFFWEWFHRFWARLVGVVFIVGFVYLLLKRKLKTEMIRPLLILFLLGALQGAIGWIMVVSGLTGDALYVKPAKLALHFVFAMGLISYAFWFALQLLYPVTRIRNARSLRRFSVALLVLIFIQVSYGALMAGHKAAAVAPTWPTINGDWIPASLFKSSPWVLNLVENTICIQFIHRGLAYLIFVGILIWTVLLFSSGLLRYERTKLVAPLGLVCIQVLLGILTLLLSPGIVANHWVFFDWFALLHQITGMLLLLSLVYAVYMLRPGRIK